MRSGETIAVKDICNHIRDINEVMIYPQLNCQKTLFWKVEGLFGSCRFTLCLTKKKEEAVSVFEKVNNQLLNVHELDLRSRY